MVTTLAGSVVGSSDGQGSSATFSFPLGVAMDAAGLIAIIVSALCWSFALLIGLLEAIHVLQGDGDNDMVRRIDISSAQVTTIAGLSRSYGRADGFGTNARFNEPRGVSLNAVGTLGLVVRSHREGAKRPSSPSSPRPAHPPRRTLATTSSEPSFSSL